MHKKFLTGLLYSLVSNLGIKALWILVIEVAVQRTVGTEAYGAYFSVLNFTFLFVMLLDLGLTNFNTRNIAQHEHLIKKHFPNISVIKLFIGILYLIIAAVSGFLSGFRGELFYVLMMMSGVQFLLSFTMYLRSNIVALLFFKLDALLGIADRLVLIITVGLWLFTDLVPLEFTILSYAGMQLLSAFLAFLTAFIVNIYITGFSIPKNIQWPFYISILKQSLPFALLVLLTAIYLRSDAVLMNWLLPDGNRASGVYAASFRLFDAFSQVAILFSGILLPVFANLLKKKEAVSSIMNISMSLLAAMTLIIAMAGLFFSKVISGILYDQHTEEIARVLMVYLPGLFLYSMALTTGTLLTAAGKIRLLNKISAFCAAVNIGANLVFIPIYKEEASAVIALITYGILAALQSYYAIYHTDFKPKTTMVSRFILFAVAITGTGLILQFSLENSLKALLVFLAVGTGMAFVSGLVNLKELIKIFRGRIEN